MAGNSWQSPVAGEPAWGSPHTHFYQLYNDNPTDTDWHAVDVSAQVPVGTMGIFLQIEATGATANRLMAVSTASGGNVWVQTRVPAATTYGVGSGFVPLTSSLTFYWYVSDADVTTAKITMTNYYL